MIILYGFFPCFDDKTCEGGWNVVYLGGSNGVPREVLNGNNNRYGLCIVMY
jgi:hypothetical protein